MASTEVEKRRALGKGLASLIPSGQDENTQQVKKELFLCDIEKIVPNTYQPRKIFQKASLEDLSDSVKTHGVIQPLIVRRKEGHFEIIAGERRWRAAQKAGLRQVPVLVKEDPGDGASLEMAIIENVQREDLNCIEEAMAYQQLLDEFQLSQDEISVRVGKNRATIANMLRLLRLPQAIREDLTNAKMTMGHARALLSLDSAEDQVEIRDQIIRRKLSVRETERKVNEVLRKNKKGTQPERGATEPNIQALEESLRRQFGTQVRIVGNEMRGFLQFTYGSKEDLMRLVDKLQGFKSIDNSDVSPAN